VVGRVRLKHFRCIKGAKRREEEGGREGAERGEREMRPREPCVVGTDRETLQNCKIQKIKLKRHLLVWRAKSSLYRETVIIHTLLALLAAAACTWKEDSDRMK